MLERSISCQFSRGFLTAHFPEPHFSGTFDPWIQVSPLEASLLFRWFFLLVGISSIWNCSADSGAAMVSVKEKEMFGKVKEETYVIASPLSGVLLRDGKPMPNARLLRRLTWNGNEEGVVQEFRTDEEGRFELPVHEEGLSLNFLTQFVAKSTVYVASEADENMIWYSSKLTPELNSEIENPVVGLTCDMADDEVIVHGRESSVPNIMTRCRWSSMKKA
ncbi:DUF6795 domain-containing protein [Microbulbifer harenosus]|uniref:DUF6795 domain-containing protein n=1 Tax=Microbulbifer harenosus TaxID=2576840 RepID=A0ABY2UGZ3_9GAMM|nr:DUF6795 domain-containing protein [Microbulbifer harenosus]TLM77030.1 hypothetical protein FDY93_11775 [Microbulbifer harenosus]